MSREKLPGFVPLPEAGSYTDKIQVGEFGFPVGFDEEQLQVNLRGLSRTMCAAGLGKVTISGYRGDATESVFGIGGISADGSATATKLGFMSKADIYDTDLEDRGSGGLPIEYQWREANLRVNSSEVESRITADGDKWPRRQFNPRAQAKYMNRALQGGLSSAAVDSYMPHPKFNVAIWAGMVAFSESLEAIGGHQNMVQHLPYALAGWLPANAMLHVLELTRRRDNLPPRKWSLMYHIPFDRLAVAKVMARSTRFVRAAS